MARSLRAASADPDQAKFDQRLVDKLKYCKEILVSIRNASANLEPGAPVPMNMPGMGDLETAGPSRATSTNSLR